MFHGKSHSSLEGQTSKSPSPRRCSKEKKGMFNICSSKAVCAFVLKSSTNSNVSKMRLFQKQSINFINDEVFLDSNSPRRRRYRICPNSSHGFRELEKSLPKRGMLTEESRKMFNPTFEPWEAKLEQNEL
jgi:hypothetical protein